MAAISTLVDTFATQDAAKWTFPAGTSVVSGRISIPASTSYPTVTSVANYDLTNSSFYAQLVQTLNSAAGTQTYYDLIASSGNSVGWLVETSGQLKASRTVSSVATTVATVGTFNATTHKYLRIRHNGSQVIWEYSADAVSWTAAGSPWTPTITITALQVGLGAGYFTSGSGTALWDNVNTTGVDNTVAGFAGNVGGAAGLLGASRALAGNGPEVGGGGGALAASKALSGFAACVASATGTLAASRAVAGFGANAASAVGTFNLNALSGFAGNVGSATGDLAATRPLAGYAPEVGGGAGLLGRTRPLDGFAPEAGSAVGDLNAARALAGVAGNVNAAGADLGSVGPAQPLPLPDDPLPPAAFGWRPSPPVTYRPPTVVYA